MSTAAQLLVRQVSEEALDLVDPGCADGREVQMEAWVPEQPALDKRGFVSSVIVEHEMDSR